MEEFFKIASLINIATGSNGNGTNYLEPLAGYTSLMRGSFALIFCTTSVLLALAIRLVINVEKKETKFYFDELPKSAEEIPKYYHFSRWMPTIVEGFWACVLLRKGGVHALQKLGEACGLIFEIAVFNKRVLVVRDPVLLQKILGSSSMHVVNKPRALYDSVVVDSLRDGMVGSPAELWHRHRKMVANCFSYAAMATYLNLMNKHASNLSTVCWKKVDKIDGGQILDLLNSTSIKILAEIMLGQDRRTERASEKVHQHMRVVKEILSYKNIHHPELALITPIWWLNPKRRTFNSHIKSLHEIIDADIQKCMEEHEQLQKLGGTHDKPFKSLFEEMLGKGASLKEVGDEVKTFIIVGREGTVTAMIFFLQLIAENRDCLRACQEEIDSVFNSKAGTDKYLSLDNLAQLKFLERCIMESLRIAPAAPTFYREVSGDLQVDNFKFKKGTIFFFSPWTIHRNPKYYPNPESFDPDRWLPENVSKRPVCSFVAFSYGQRNCVGHKVAMQKMKVVLAWLLRSFDVATTDKLSQAKVWFDATLIPERDFNIILTRRDNFVK